MNIIEQSTSKLLEFNSWVWPGNERKRALPKLLESQSNYVRNLRSWGEDTLLYSNLAATRQINKWITTTKVGGGRGSRGKETSNQSCYNILYKMSTFQQKITMHARKV